MLPLTAAFETVAQMFSTNTFNEQEAKVSWAGRSLLSMLSLGGFDIFRSDRQESTSKSCRVRGVLPSERERWMLE